MSGNSAFPELKSLYTLVCIHENLLVFVAVPAHNRWLWP